MLVFCDVVLCGCFVLFAGVHDATPIVCWLRGAVLGATKLHDAMKPHCVCLLFLWHPRVSFIIPGGDKIHERTSILKRPLCWGRGHMSEALTSQLRMKTLVCEGMAPGVQP